MLRKSLVLTSLAALALTGCSKEGDIDSSGGIAITRTTCPGVAIPVYTGDVTLFTSEDARTADAIDVVAAITNLRSNCAPQGGEVVSNASFDVVATRINTNGARQVVLPYFATVVQGGRVVVSKRMSNIVLTFADGARRAEARGSATGIVNQAAATLPPAIQERLTRKRRAGDADAALDPLADPDVRAAVQKASFELLIGFQLSDAQLRYNATR